MYELGSYFWSSLLRSPLGSKLAAKASPTGSVARQGLEALALWLSDRDRYDSRSENKLNASNNSAGPHYPKPIGTELDLLANLEKLDQFKSLEFARLATVRSMVEPRKDFCVIATARNEGIYLLEWIAYYRSIGADVILYTNDNDDGSDDLLCALSKAGLISWTPNEISDGGNAQNKAYAHALTLNPKVLDYRWALIADLDEYLLFNKNKFNSIQDFLSWHEKTECDAITINWIHHGPCKQAKWRDDFIGRRFPYAAEKINEYNKCIIKPRNFSCSEPHFPIMLGNKNPVIHAENGQIHESPPGINNSSISFRPSAEYAWINHYFHKSVQEYLVKFSRNRGNHPKIKGLTKSVITSDFVKHFMHYFDKEFPVSLSPDDCAPNFDAELLYLREFEGVREAENNLKELYREKIANIHTIFQDAPGILEAELYGRNFIRMLVDGKTD